MRTVFPTDFIFTTGFSFYEDRNTFTAFKICMLKDELTIKRQIRKICWVSLVTEYYDILCFSVWWKLTARWWLRSFWTSSWARGRNLSPSGKGKTLASGCWPGGPDPSLDWGPMDCARSTTHFPHQNCNRMTGDRKLVI